MNPVFRAGRALGQAEICRLEGTSGVRYVNKAATELSRTTELKTIARHLQGIARDWKNRSKELPNIMPAIQAHGGMIYHAVSCGVLLGLALEACKVADKDTVISQAKSSIVQWLKGANEHAYAIKAQGLQLNLPDFRPNFNRVISPIQVVKKSRELRNHAQFIERLSNTVGNKIK